MGDSCSYNKDIVLGKGSENMKWRFFPGVALFAILDHDEKGACMWHYKFLLNGLEAL